MTKGFLPRGNSMSYPLSGDDSNRFDLAIVSDLFESIKRHMPKRSYQDDYIFISHFRLLASAYHFLGGRNFSTHLFEQLPGNQGQHMIEKWLEGQTVPASCGTRKQAIDIAIRLVEHLRKLRQDGATLTDVTSH